MNFLTSKKFLFVGFMIIILVAIPLTIFTIQQQQEIRSRAAAATTLSFNPSDISVAKGGQFTLEILINPNGNQISNVKLDIAYDQTKLEPLGQNALTVDPTSGSSIIEGPLYDPDTGSASIVIAISPTNNAIDPTKVTRSQTRIATITFKALPSVATTTPTQIIFTDKTVAYAIDDTTGSVIQQKIPSSVTIDASSSSITPTAPASSLSPTPLPSGTTRSGSSSSGNQPAGNQPPTCTLLGLDTSPSGSSPLSITFTASGTDPDGTIQKATFTFGDGIAEDIQLDTKQVNTQKQHTYQTPGTFVASAIFADNQGAVSIITNACRQVITVFSPTATPSASGKGGVYPTVPPVPSPGPTQTLLGIGLAGVVLTILGGLIFLKL